MMLKITKIQESRSEVLLKLEGKITAEWAVLLDGECQVLLRNERAVYLDCANVDFIDARGVEVLNNLPRGQVTLMNAPALSRSCCRLKARHERGGQDQ